MGKPTGSARLPPGRHVPIHRTRLAQLVDAAHLSRDDAVRKFGRIAAEMKAAGELQENMSVSPRQFARWMAGEGDPRPAACRVLQRMFELSVSELLGPPTLAADGANYPSPAAEGGHESRETSDWPRKLDLPSEDREDEVYADLDEIQTKIRSLLGKPDDSSISLDSLEDTAELKAREAVDAPPRVMIASLSRDLDQVYRALRHSSAGQVGGRRLLRAGALYSALLAEEFMIVGQASRSRRWFLTADALSSAAEDEAARSLVGCLASRLPLYFGEIAESVDMARRVSDIAPPHHLSTALAPMVEALALAQLGDMAGSEDALSAARSAFELLDGRFLQDTVFGFSIRRFTFYESRVLLDVGQLSAAWKSQDEALMLYPSAMIGDVAMIHLDRARLLVKQGDVETGCAHAADVLLSMPKEQRAEIFRSRALRLLAAVPRTARALPAVADLREAFAHLSRDS